MQKSIILLGAICLACSVQAQTTNGSTTSGANSGTNGNNNIMADSTQRYGMHRHWEHRDGGYGRDGNRSDGEGRGGWAEGRGGWAEGRGMMGRDGARRIHYTPEQRKQIRDIAMDYHKKAADLFNNDNLTLRQYKAGLIALQKDRKSKMQALLTPEQKDQLAKAKQHIAENMQVMAAAHMERLKIHLGLSDDQVATLKTKEEALHTQLRSIHDNDDLLPQQKMEQFEALRDKRTEIIKSVLTPDQLTKFNEMEMARRGDRGHRPMDGMRQEGK